LSVRFSQLLVAIVLALLAIVLYRTFNAYSANAAFNELHARGTRVAGQATQTLGQRIAALEALAARTSIEGYRAGDFARRARSLMRRDAALQAIDYFNADDVHQAHIIARNAPEISRLPPAKPVPPETAVGAVEQAMFDADLSRATSMSDNPARPRTRLHPAANAQFFLAARVLRKHRDIGTLVAYLEPRELLLNDLQRQLGSRRFALDDDRGHSITTASDAMFAAAGGSQTFNIQFADRTLRLTVPQQPARYHANVWWFFIGWLALVIAICLPIESVNTSNRRVRMLNEQLEIRVAGRTRELESTLQETRRLATQLEREMQARALFIETASHELRTPVTTLRTLAALLSEKLSSRAGLNGDDLRLLQVLEYETRRLAHLVDDLLKIAKIDAPEASMTLRIVDLREIVRTELSASQQVANDAGPAIALRLPESPALVYGDADALGSILNNLVDNARKFTPLQGRIVVTVASEGAFVQLSVADSGIGIPQSDLPHIFERFYRVRSAASGTLGSGLGLAIVARLVDLMHGTISVTSEIGRGTTISIEYPAPPESFATAGSRQSAQAS